MIVVHFNIFCSVVGTISPQPLSPSVGPSKKFSVKYLGHTEIKDGKGN